MGAPKALKIGVLTSSRADFGIYEPLLQELNADQRFEIDIIAFGTHLSPYHGYTLQMIEKAGYGSIKTVYGMPLSDAPEAIANAYGQLVSNFSQYWAAHSYDWVLALGDRFEMSAAVQAGIPMQVRFAHLHGGETTLGAIDNVYRHQITLAAALHFTATEAFSERVVSLIGQEKGVHWVGALSVDGIDELSIPEWPEVASQFKLPAQEDFVLVTFHPETIAYRQNEAYSQAAYEALAELAKEIAIIITMPNADTAGSLFRKKFQILPQQRPRRVFLVENFGRLNYFAAMRQARFLLGNTSSGIVEAASFGKYVVDVGKRQQGRAKSDNIMNVPFEVSAILEACNQAMHLGTCDGPNIYHRAGTAKRIAQLLCHEEL
jgi:GDP/UDP-N,N'-diacetylbacillosamine 2-epimerase (hydrolysing)